MADELLSGENQDATADDETTVTSEEEVQDLPNEQKDEKADSDDDKSEDNTEDEDKEPVEYEAFTLPDGMELDEEAMKEATPLLQELNLKQEDAQKVVDVYSKIKQQEQEKFMQVLEDRNNKWVEDITKDKEIGGERLDESTLQVKQMFNKFDSDNEVQQYLDSTGQGNCAPIFKMLARIAPHFKEDTLVTDKGGTKPTKSINEKMGWKDIEDY